MILVRSPLRITLGGGGTDLPAYYRSNGGMFFTAAINKFVYVSVLKPFRSGIYVNTGDGRSWSPDISTISHPLIREALRLCAPEDWVPQIEITTLADVPAGTGLGSSSACACALLKALTTFFEPQTHESVGDLAENACFLEMNVLGEPIGKQDAYASALGGMTPFSIDEQGQVTPQAGIDWRIQEKLESRLLLYFTGYSRSASEILKPAAAGEFNDNLHQIHYFGDMMLRDVRAAELWSVGPILTAQYVLKCQRSPEQPHHIQDLYVRGMEAGASGGKLVGAGGGGFLLFYTPDPERLRAGMAGYAEELPFRFEDEGTMVVCQ